LEKKRKNSKVEKKRKKKEKGKSWKKNVKINNRIALWITHPQCI
jgi:hypothetical protein